MTKILALDWSGTVSNDIARVVEAANYALKKCGVTQELDIPTFKENSSLNWTKLYRNFGAKQSASIIQSLYEEGYGQAQTPVEIFPGAKELLKDCLDLDIKTCVISSHPWQFLTHEARMYGVWDLITAGIRGSVKQKDLELRTIRNGGSLIYIGDMADDAIAAQKAGAQFIGIAGEYSYHSESQLAEHPNEGIYSSIEEIVNSGALNKILG